MMIFCDNCANSTISISLKTYTNIVSMYVNTYNIVCRYVRICTCNHRNSSYSINISFTTPQRQVYEKEAFALGFIGVCAVLLLFIFVIFEHRVGCTNICFVDCFINTTTQSEHDTNNLQNSLQAIQPLQKPTTPV